MSEKVLLFKFEGRDSDLNASFNRIEARIEQINTRFAASGRTLQQMTVSQANQNLSPAFDTRQMQDFVRLQNQINSQTVQIERAKAASLSTQIKELQAERAIEQAITATAAAEIKLIQLEQQRLKLANQSAASTKTASPKDALRDAALTDIAKMEKQRVAMHQSANQAIEAGEKALTKIQVGEVKARNNAELAELKKLENQSKSGGGSDILSQVFAGSFLGSALGGNVGAVISDIIGGVKNLTQSIVELGIESVSTGAKFEGTRNAVAVFSGSLRAADQELAAIDETARNTNGLRLEAAEQGYLQLRNLGFEAENSRKLIAGLAKEQLLSNADEMSVQRVVTNLTQLSAGSTRAAADVKEIFHSLPSLRKELAEAFGTLDTKKLGEIFSKNPDQAMEKLSAAMEKTKGASGGLDNALGKMSDAGTQAERQFAKPILEPATRSVEILTTLLEKNQGTWSRWGQTVGDIIEGVNNAAAGAGKENPTLDYINSVNSKLNRLTLGVISGGYSELGRYALNKIEESGQRTRELREAANNAQRIRETPGLMRADNTFNFDMLNGKSKGEIDAANRNNELKKIQAEEVARQKNLESAKSAFARQSADSEKFYSIEEAKQQAHLSYTAQEQLNNAQALEQIKQSSFKSQISIQSSYFDAQITAANGDSKEVQKIESEKYKTISGLQKQAAIDEINSQKEVQQLERQILNQRRQDLIQYKQIQLQTVAFNTDNLVTDAQRKLSNSTSANGFDGVSALVKSSAEQTRQFLRQSYELQLQDLTLTVEQRTNLIHQMYLEEGKIAEDARRKVLDIENQKWDKVGNIIRQASDNFQNLLNVVGSTQQAFEGFFSPETFSKKGFQNVLVDSDFAGLQAQMNDAEKLLNRTQAAREKANLAKTNFNVEHGGSQENLSAADNESYLIIASAIEKTDQAFLSASNNFTVLKAKVTGFLGDFNTLGQQLQKNLDFDAMSADLLVKRQALERAGLEESIKLTEKLLDNENTRPEKNANTILGLQTQLNLLNNQKSVQEQIQAIEIQRNSQESNKGLAEYRDSLRSGDAVSVGAVQYLANKQITKEQISLVQQNIGLQEQLARSGEDAADRYQNAWLKAIIDVRDADIRAAESQIESQVRLADASTIHIEQVRAAVLDHLASAKTATQNLADAINNSFDKALDSVDKLLDKTGVGKIPIIGDFVKGQAESMFAGLASKLFAGTPLEGLTNSLNKTGNPVLDEAKKQTGELEKINQKLGGSSLGNTVVNIASGTTSFSHLAKNLGFSGTSGKIGAIGGGGLFSGADPNNPAIMHLAGGSGNVFDLLGLSANNTIAGAQPTASGTRSGSNGFLSQILGKGGIFGADGFGNNVGTYGAIGGAASLIGGLIPGKVGGVISGAGSGMAMGAQIGSMFGPGPGTAIGAAIGAAAGGLMSLFGGDPKRKEDAKQNIPQLHQNFANSIAGFNQLIKDVESLKTDPYDALKTGKDIRTQIASGFGIQMKSKKYSKIASNEITAQLQQIDAIPDGLMLQLQRAVSKARDAKEFSNEFVATFATGGYMDGSFHDQYRDFKRRNGYLTGGIQGVDSLPALLMPKEIVMNPVQQQRVRELVGFDPFPHVGIPGYPTSSRKPVAMAGGGAVGDISVSSGGSRSQSAAGSVTIESLDIGVSVEIGEQVAVKITSIGLKSSENQNLVVKTVRTHVDEVGMSDGLPRDIEKAKGKV